MQVGAGAAQRLPVHADLLDHGSGQQLAHPAQEGAVESRRVQVLEHVPEGVSRRDTVGQVEVAGQHGRLLLAEVRHILEIVGSAEDSQDTDNENGK